MPECKERKDVLRCPFCLGKENDVLLRKNDSEFYCVKCSFRGTREEIMQYYALHKKRFANRTKRITLEEIERL